MILVQIEESLNVNHRNGKADNENISTGWVVLRSLTEFHVISYHQIISLFSFNSYFTFQELNRKLRPLCPEIRTLDLPSTAFKLFFIKNDKASSEKAKGQIQKYLNVRIHVLISIWI